MIAYPHKFPCRTNENIREIHCDSCAMVPGLLRQIEELKAELLFKNMPTPEIQCPAIKSAGWGTSRRCLFKEGHSGQHSWVVDI